MTLEITTFDGTGEELSDLITTAWASVLENKAWFPIWDADFINWCVMDPRVLDRDLVTVARKDGKLAGCVVALPCGLRYRGQELNGSLASFLSISPEIKRPGFALRLVEANRQAQLDKGIVLSLGIHDSHEGARAAKFWSGWKKRHPDEFIRFGEITCWTKAIDGRAIAQGAMTRSEALAARLGSVLPLGWTGRKGRGALPDMADLKDHMRIAAQREEAAEITKIYTEETLAHTIDHPYCIAMKHPTADALVSGYMIDWSGRAKTRVGFIDFIAGAASPRDMADTLIAVAREMKARGAAMIAHMDQGAAPRKAMWRAGFAPVPARIDYYSWVKHPDVILEGDIRAAVPFT
ncbi:MAG: hypothetical protein AAF647_02365 [Pseudomonadota bacterium]